MAAEDPIESLQREASCSICLDYFSDPVSIDCGHNFCRDCITRCSGKSERKFSCPQCRGTAQKRMIRPNRELANVAEIAKRLRLQGGKSAGVEMMCEKHQEALKLFCQEDQTPICLICRESRIHRSHAVAPIEEAAQEYKEQIQIQLQILKEKRLKLLGLKATREMKSQHYLEQTKTVRRKIASEFQRLHQFLQQQEQLLLAQLGELEKEVVKTQTENVTILSKEISYLSDLISEMEGKYQQPVDEFLQGIRSTLNRCESRDFEKLMETFPEVEKKLNNFSQKNIVLKSALQQFKDNLLAELKVEWVNVKLDPDTANRHLVLSEDQKSVRWEETEQDLPNNPERFDTYCSILGCEGFTSGRHYWEVHMGPTGYWAVGVARESAWRKGWISLDPCQGIWAVGLCGEQYRAFTSVETSLPLNGRPKIIRVSLDYEGGHVAFFDVHEEVLSFTFPPASFNGERILPFFWVWESQLMLCP
ncbi:zinc finger protein RFP [Alligator mississippiensis]|nr:zinc finger protein RFP [Alligator mississippiensis]